MTRLADNAEHGLWDPVDEALMSRSTVSYPSESSGVRPLCRIAPQFYYDVLANPDGSRACD